MNKGQKSKSEKGLLFKFVLVFLMLLLAILTVGTVKEYLRQKDLDKEMETLQAEIDKLNLDRSQFLSSIEAYQNDFFLEQEARLKFNMQKPGEKVLVIPAERINEIGDTSYLLSSSTGEKKENIYIKNIRSWWDYFFQVRTRGD